jgi:hypothetical protein
VVLAAGVAATAVRGGFQRSRRVSTAGASQPHNAPGTTRTGPERAGYAQGPAFGLVGLGLVSVFDTVHVNMQTAAMLGILIALCLPRRPAEAGLLAGYSAARPGG